MQPETSSALSLDIRALARALGGEVASRNSILAPGPGHSRKDRSLSITLSSDAPDGFLVNSFAGDDPITCRDHVRAAAGLPSWSPRSGSGVPTPRIAPRPVPVPDADEERRAAWLLSRVLGLWDETKPPEGTLVERYLTAPPDDGGRGLQFPEGAGTVLRYHPRCPWKDSDGKLISVPAMVAAMRTIEGDKLVAVHRTRLTPDGRKADRRMLGSATGAAIKLDPDEAVTLGLVIGEGVETALAARQLGLRPVWATGSATAIAKFPVLSGVEGLTILGENDANGANERAVNECAMRWHEAGRGVIIAAPKFGKDVNDALRGRVA